MSDPTEVLTETPVHVEPGKTSVLEIKTTGQAGGPETGSFEIWLVDEGGNPVAAGPVYLLDKDGKVVYTVTIDTDESSANKGYGKLDGIIPAEYTVTLQKPEEPVKPVEPPVKPVAPERKKLPQIVLFGHNSDGLTPAAGKAIDTVAEYLSREEQKDVKKVYCIGFTNELGKEGYNKKLSYDRAITVKKALDKKLDEYFKSIKASKPNLFIDGYGEIPGKEKEAMKQNRRVEFWIHEPPEKSIYKVTK